MSTPLIKINYNYNGKEQYIYAKLEYYNITGSIKDRVVDYIVKKSIQNGELKKGMTLYEATSGNTGIALASVGARLGYKVHIFMPDWVSQERIKIMKMFGAEITCFSKDEGGFTRCIKEAKEASIKNNGYYLNQFENENNVMAHFETTAKELIEEVPECINGFVAGVGTGGTLMGVGKRLKENNSKAIIAALEPSIMPMLSKNKIYGSHKIEGIGDEFVPKIVDKSKIDEIILVDDDDAVNMARILATKLGLGVGISSGANFLGAVLLKDKINKNVVTVFVDDNKKYLSTDLSKDIDCNKDLVSNNIEILNYVKINNNSQI